MSSHRAADDPAQAACSRLDHDGLIRTAALFDSTHPGDHLRARRTCATCPLVQPCLATALAIAAEHPAPVATSRGSTMRGPDGTWGGLLWHSGHVVDPKREHTWAKRGVA